MFAHRLAPGFAVCAVVTASGACIFGPGRTADVSVGDGDGDGDGDGNDELSFNGFTCKDRLEATNEDLQYYGGDNEYGYSCRLETSCEEGEVLVVSCRTIGASEDDDPATTQYNCDCTIGGDTSGFRDDGLCGATDEARDRRTKEGCAEAFGSDF